MKDGYAAHGKVKREMEVIIDPATGEVIPIVKASNCFLLDDRVRYVVFGQKQVDRVEENLDIREGNVFFTRDLGQRTRKKLPKEAQLLEPKPFDQKWERNFPIRTRINDGITNPIVTGNVKQRITILTPYFVRLEALDYDWTANYQTKEFGPAVIIPLIRTHPEMTVKPGETLDVDRRLKIVRFCTQAGWIAEAKSELSEVAKDFPTEKEKLAMAETALKQLEQQTIWEEADLYAKVGRHAIAQQLLNRVALSELPGPFQADAANLKTRYENLESKLKEARRAFVLCYEGVVGPPEERFANAIPQITRSLNYDTLDRLEAFATIGRQLEQEIRTGKEVKHTFEEVLSLAMTGWVLGPQAAEASLTTADRLWTLRERLLEYQRSAAAVNRKPLLTAIERDSMLSVSEIARAITMLPPADEPPAGPMPTGALQQKTNNPFSPHPPYTYHLQLPPEYHPNRSYPLLIVLPPANQGTADAINPWIAEAARHGYVLACVDWGASFKGKYEYSPIEHAAAQECLQDVKRYVNVDSDRVFLAGYADGGNAAIDVALSHPDLFAGVIPINGRPRNYSSLWYWRNAQSLPFYLVIGELTGDTRVWDAQLFENWASKGYPSLMIMFRGRASDFFPAELPNMFDWMDRKRRALGFPELGRFPGGSPGSEEYQTLRVTDNRFYWITTNQIDPKITNAIKDIATHKGQAAAIQANINGNQININTRGVKQLSLWLGRAYDPQTGVRDMIDFAKPVRIQINNRLNWNNQNKPLEPKLETLLEDYFERGDRRRLCFVKVDFDKIP